MALRARLLIARDRRWPGAPVDLYALGRTLEGSGAASVVKGGPDRLVIEIRPGSTAERVVEALPPGVTAEPVQVFEPM